MRFERLGAHERNECPKRKVSCDYCGEMVRAAARVVCGRAADRSHRRISTRLRATE
jgi:hypothetical protein